MALVWVIGSGGLLGKALVSELAQSEDNLFDPKIKFNWGDPDLVVQQLNQVARRFSVQTFNGPWKIYWAAGTGTMHSTEEIMQEEVNILEALISTLLGDSNLILSAGSFVFASSAGAIYAGSPEGLITESTLPSPINAYGRAKLLQESIISRLNQSGQGANVISCRISTLYGFKEKDGKQQGLIAEMIRRALSHQVIHIYVPLETMRDYISASIAANKMIKAAALFEKNPGIHLKIIASGVSKSIAHILAIARGLCKRNLRVVTQADVKSTQYERIIQYKSVNGCLDESNINDNLIAGISNLLNTMLKNIAKNGNKT